MASAERHVEHLIRADIGDAAQHVIDHASQQITVVVLHLMHDRAKRIVVGVVLLRVPEPDSMHGVRTRWSLRAATIPLLTTEEHRSMANPYDVAARRFEHIAFLIDPSLDEAQRQAAWRGVSPSTSRIWVW